MFEFVQLSWFCLLVNIVDEVLDLELKNITFSSIKNLLEGFLVLIYQISMDDFIVLLLNSLAISQQHICLAFTLTTVHLYMT